MLMFYLEGEGYFLFGFFNESVLDSDLIGRKTKDGWNTIYMCMHRHSSHSGCSSSPFLREGFNIYLDEN